MEGKKSSNGPKGAMEKSTNNLLVNYLYSQKLITKEQYIRYGPLVGSALTGFTKGFFVYMLPMTLLKRRIAPYVVQRSLALGTFAGSFRVLIILFKDVVPYLNPAIRSVLVNKKHALAGYLAALIALCVDPSLCSSIFVLWMCIRASRCLIPHIRGGPTLVMCISAAQILTSWVKLRDQINPGYLRFLDWIGGKTKEMVGTPLQQNMLARDICTVAHPHTTSHFAPNIPYFFDMMKRSLKVYTPLYLGYFLVRAAVKQQVSVKSVLNLIENVLRSSTFLSLYCVFAWAGLCFQRWRPDVLLNMGVSSQRVTVPWMYVQTFFCGLSALVERPSRRVELAAYCLTYAADGWYRMLLKRKLVREVPGFGMIFLSLAIAVMTAHHEQQPHLLSKWLLGIPKAPAPSAD